MLIKTLLNKIDRFKSFVYGKCKVETGAGEEAVVIEVQARKNSQPECPKCHRKSKAYDRQPARMFEYVPFWTYKVYLQYAPRRVSCPEHGVKVEFLPWCVGKERITTSLKIYLASWAQRLSWQETAGIFKTSWNTVYRSVQYVVEYGLAKRTFDNVTQIGVDEIAVFKGHKYLTMVYQINNGIKRLLWCGPERKMKTLLHFFAVLGEEGSKKLEFVCSDMWKPYLNVIAKQAPNALNVLDRFHIMKKFNEALDEIRRNEVKGFKAKKKKMSFCMADGYS